MSGYQISETGRKNKKVIFLLTGWGTKMWMFTPFAQILAFNGYYCITYTYDKEILSPQTADTVNKIKSVSKSILDKIEELKANGFRDFYIFGTSLGSTIALMVANKSKDISKVVLNTTGSDIAETVWGWDRFNSSFKNSLISQGFTLSKLKNEWKDISPENNINNLKNKSLLIYLSRKDEVIPYKLGKKLADQFKERNYQYTLVINNNFNHIFTGFYNLVNISVYLSFLKGS